MSQKIDNLYIDWPADKDALIKVMCWSDSQPVNTHKHEFIEIAFIAYGSCIHTYHKSDVKLIPGDVFIVTPHEEHSYKISSKTIIYNCLFYAEALGEDWDTLLQIKSIHDLLVVEPFYRLESKQQQILHLEPSEASNLEILLKAMLDEQQTNQIGYNFILKAKLTVLITLLGRTWKKQMNKSSILYSGKRDMLAEALHFIENNMDSSLKIDDIASKVYLSPNYFSMIFKKHTGLTPIEYINKIRISKACLLLKSSNQAISEIAEIVGINDLNYFSRLFKSLTGYSPSEYRKK